MTDKARPSQPRRLYVEGAFDVALASLGQQLVGSCLTEWELDRTTDMFTMTFSNGMRVRFVFSTIRPRLDASWPPLPDPEIGWEATSE